MKFMGFVFVAVRVQPEKQSQYEIIALSLSLFLSLKKRKKKKEMCCKELAYAIVGVSLKKSKLSRAGHQEI